MDYSDCRYECCTGDLCNDFDFTVDVSPTTSQPTNGLTTETFQDRVQLENIQDVQRNEAVRNTVAAGLTTSASGSNQGLTSTSIENLCRLNNVRTMQRARTTIELKSV